MSRLSRLPCRPMALAATISLFTSAGVRYSRVRFSLLVIFGGGNFLDFTENDVWRLGFGKVENLMDMWVDTLYFIKKGSFRESRQPPTGR